AEALFGRGDVRALDPGTLAEIAAEVPRSTHAVARLARPGASLAELLPETSLAGSRRGAREVLPGGAIAGNGERAAPDRRLTEEDLLRGGLSLLRRGKRQWHATGWVRDAD